MLGSRCIVSIFSLKRGTLTVSPPRSIMNSGDLQENPIQEFKHVNILSKEGSNT